jgi:hypothetical protein
MTVPALIDAAIAAHGGRQRWQQVSSIETTISANGFLFTAKQRPPLRRVRMSAWAREPRFALHDHPQPGQTSELRGEDEVRIQAADGTLLAHRARPRQAFAGLGHVWRWDALDLVYFAGYATWNYLLTPFLFLREGFRFEALAPLRTAQGTWQGVRAHFPPGLPTHSAVQDFYFDEQALLRRLDYTAEVVGGWAHAAHLCEDYREFDGLQVPTRRTVLPLLLGQRPLPGPTLVALQVHELHLRTD